MGNAAVSVTRHGSVATLALNRPEEANRLDAALGAAVADACEALDDDDDVRVVVVAGKDGVFATGLGEPAACGPASAVAALAKPTIAWIEGDCLDQGLALALACDIRMTAGAAFGMRHAVHGLLPWDGGSQRLSRLVGRGQALRLLLTGDVISDVEALRIGLVELAGGREQAMELAQRSRGGCADRRRLRQGGCARRPRHGAGGGAPPGGRPERAAARYIRPGSRAAQLPRALAAPFRGTMTGFTAVRYEKQVGGAATITLDRPAVINAYNIGDARRSLRGPRGGAGRPGRARRRRARCRRARLLRGRGPYRVRDGAVAGNRAQGAEGARRVEPVAQHHETVRRSVARLLPGLGPRNRLLLRPPGRVG